MPETTLLTTRASVVACLATPAALDTLDGALRTAPDEALLLGGPKAAPGRMEEVGRSLTERDAHALVVDVSDGWTGFTLAGPGAREVFAHLSQLHLPDDEGFVQGDVGRLAAKVVVRAPGDRITLFVPAPQAAYLRDRILGLGAVERAEPEVWGAP